MTPLAAQEFEPTYRYEGRAPNRLRAVTRLETTAALDETRAARIERLPGLRSPYQQTVDASDVRPEISGRDETYRWPENRYSSPGSVSTTNDTPFNFARQQRETIVGEVEPLLPAPSDFDPLMQQPESYSILPENWDTKEGWGNRVRHRFGVCNAGCCTLWQAAADFYYLKRMETSPVTILVDDTTRSIEAFNAQSLDFGYNVGYGIRLRRGLGCGTSLNVGYFGLYDQQDAIELTGDLALVLPGFATGGNVASYNTDYQSQLHSAEINMRQALGGRFGILAGFRYINLQEDLLLSSQLGAIVTLQHYDIDVDNNLFGAQLGTDFCLGRCHALQFDAMVKCGFFLNNASQTTSSALIGVPVSASTDSFAVAGEAGIYATYCINPAWSVRAGCQVLGLHGVALAPQQLQQSNLANGNSSINAKGSVFYAGASLGIHYAW
jgi:hypothetical protein